MTIDFYAYILLSTFLIGVLAVLCYRNETANIKLETEVHKLELRVFELEAKAKIKESSAFIRQAVVRALIKTVGNN